MRLETRLSVLHELLEEREQKNLSHIEALAGQAIKIDALTVNYNGLMEMMMAHKLKTRPWADAVEILFNAVVDHEMIRGSGAEQVDLALYAVKNKTQKTIANLNIDGVAWTPQVKEKEND